MRASVRAGRRPETRSRSCCSLRSCTESTLGISPNKVLDFKEGAGFNVAGGDASGLCFWLAIGLRA